LICPDCGSKEIRTFSKWNKKLKSWDWLNGCNKCDWELIDDEITSIKLDELTKLAKGETIQ